MTNSFFFAYPAPTLSCQAVWKTSRSNAIHAQPTIERPDAAPETPPDGGPGNPGSGNRGPGNRGTGSKGGSPLVLILLVVLVVVLLGGAGGAWYLLHHRAAPGEDGGGSAKKANAEQEKKAVASSPTTVILDPFVANLADAGGRSYLRVALTLEVQMPVPADDGKKAKEEKGEKKEADPVLTAVKTQARDVVLGVLNRETANQLLAPDGKEDLKAALKTAFAAHKPPIAVEEIYFTDFLVQQ